MLKKEQVVDWVANPVTRLLSQAVQERVNELKEELVLQTNEGLATVIRGQIMAFRAVLDWKPEVEEDQEETDEVQS